jgi:hypothetical protein
MLACIAGLCHLLAHHAMNFSKSRISSSHVRAAEFGDRLSTTA